MELDSHERIIGFKFQRGRDTQGNLDLEMFYNVQLIVGRSDWSPDQYLWNYLLL